MTRKLMLCFAVFMLAAQVIAAQTLDCPAFVQTALAQLGDFCGSLDNNTACYGNLRVDSTFTTEVAPDFFSQPADQAALIDLDTVRTHPLDVENGLWGVAVLKAQANLARALPGEAVTFLLLGETEVQNRAVSNYERLTFTLSENTTVRALPAWNSSSLGNLNAGAQIQGDTVDSSVGWLRVFHTAGIGWLPVDALVERDIIDSLPTAPAQITAPMQAFYFSTGIGQPQCNEAPDILLVRSPENITVELNINGLDVRLGSLVALRRISADEIIMSVYQGHLELMDAGITVNAGQAITAIVDSTGTVQSLGILRDSTPDELLLEQSAAQVMAQVVPGLVVTPPDTATATTDSGEIVHIVAAGETLNAIGQLYDASVPAIMRRNNLIDANRIFVGQALIIPNPGSGYIGAAAVSLPTVSDADTSPADCGAFRGTSPLDGLNYGRNTFYWDAAPTAQAYIVTVTNLESNRSVAFAAFGDETSLVGITDDNIGAGFLVQWSVSVVINGQIACTSGPFVMQRSAPDVATAALTASWVCGTGATSFISYSGVPDGETVSFTYTVTSATTAGPPPTFQQTDGPYSGPSGTVPLGISRAPSTIISNGVATTSGGLSAAITPAVLSAATCP